MEPIATMEANLTLRFQVWKKTKGKEDWLLVAAFSNSADAEEYGEEFVEGDFTEYRVVELV
jgi:hypothetical protein